jgi:hypothetical protein
MTASGARMKRPQMTVSDELDVMRVSLVIDAADDDHVFGDAERREDQGRRGDGKEAADVCVHGHLWSGVYASPFVLMVSSDMAFKKQGCRISNRWCAGSDRR